MTELSLPPSVERRNKLDIALGYCTDLDPTRLLSLGTPLEIRVDNPEQLVDFLVNDAQDDRLYHVDHLKWRDKEWEVACFARHGGWTLFCSVFSTSLAYNPLFRDGQRRRLACGGTRIIGKRSLELASPQPLGTREDELVGALQMNLFLSEAMTGKNLSNGFNIGGSKSLVYVGARDGQFLVPLEQTRELARFMALAHNTITQGLGYLIGTGSDLNFHEHGELYYDLCSRISPNYTGSAISAPRWGRETTGNTTAPTAAGVMACIEAVTEHLGITPDERSILVKGLGGIGSAIARRYAKRGWKVYATDVRRSQAEGLQRELGSALRVVDESEWSDIPGVAIFSPNAAAASVTRANLPVLKALGVKAIIGGENNLLARDVDADVVYRDFGILTFADFLVNGGGAWIVDAEMVDRPVDQVQEWIEKYQVPTILKTIELAREENRSPEALFREFIAGKVRELLA